MKNKIKSVIEEFDLYDYHNTFDGNMLLSYKGPWDEHIVFTMGNYIKLMVKDDPVVTKRIFKVFMELAQNVSLYSAEYNELDKSKRIGIGSILVLESKDSYHFFSGNVVKNPDIIPIIDKTDVINALDREQLRSFKRRQRNLPRSEFGGANIGLIQVALTADNPLNIKLTPINEEESFFSLGVQIKKQRTPDAD